MRLTLAISIAMIALTLLAAPAGATMQYYTNQSAWAAATSDVFTIDFEDIVVPSNPGYVDYTVTGLQLHDVTFTDSGTLWAIHTPSAASYYSYPWGPSNYLRGTGWGYSIDAALPASVYAIAAQIFTNPYDYGVTVSFPTGESYVVDTPANTGQTFAGFISDQPISSVRFIASGSYYVGLDNFQYEQTPEANTVLLGGIGLVALFIARRLRRYC